MNTVVCKSNRGEDRFETANARARPEPSRAVAHAESGTRTQASLLEPSSVSQPAVRSRFATATYGSRAASIRPCDLVQCLDDLLSPVNSHEYRRARRSACMATEPIVALHSTPVRCLTHSERDRAEAYTRSKDDI